MIHWRSVGDSARSFWIEGSATFTIVASSTTMNWAKQTTTSASQRARWESAAVVEAVCAVGTGGGSLRQSGSRSPVPNVAKWTGRSACVTHVTRARTRLRRRRPEDAGTSGSNVCSLDYTRRGMPPKDAIVVTGAREHNLKGID